MDVASPDSSRDLDSRDPKEEELASAEIDRLLLEAHTNYTQRFGDPGPIDPDNGLPAAKEKHGCVNLLRLLNHRCCKGFDNRTLEGCNGKLGMFFYCCRDPEPLSVFNSICPVHHDPFDRGGGLMASEAENLFGCPGLGQDLQRCRNTNPVASFNADDRNLYTITAITKSLLKVYGSIWDLHYSIIQFEIIQKKELKQNPETPNHQRIFSWTPAVQEDIPDDVQDVLDEQMEH